MKYRELEEAFKAMDRSFKKVDQDVNHAFKNMEAVFSRIAETLNQSSPPDHYPWEKWFAWHPVKIKGKTRWLKSVYRRHKMKYGDPRMQVEWEYGDMFDVLKEAGQ